MEELDSERFAVRLDRASVTLRGIVGTTAVSFVGTLVTTAFAWAVYTSAEYGRPSWWAQAVLPLGVAMFAYLTADNLSRLFRALGVAPVATIVVGRDVRVTSRYSPVTRRSRVLPSGSTTVLTIERHTVDLKRSRLRVVAIVLTTTGIGEVRIAVTHARLEYDWETWAAREFAAIPGLVVKRAEEQ
ncbi:hypothetical protein [Demequina activiva]|uniref:Uncharacterized protein n=1 Tax=Demequina activiva TaxID=1582364 RepID=A0A919UL15_9MICO|nr:hypothetical protein [Demequina activiva]GIG55600.1 hypothetical protein Dac01nite_23520 [Demequina activiva]